MLPSCFTLAKKYSQVNVSEVHLLKLDSTCNVQLQFTLTPFWNGG